MLFHQSQTADARINLVGGVAADEIDASPSRSTPATTGQDLRDRPTRSTSLSALGALKEVERTRRDTVGPSDR
jgi:hypothetical protein